MKDWKAEPKRWEIWGYSEKTGSFRKWSDQGFGNTIEEVVANKRARTRHLAARYAPGQVIMARRHYGPGIKPKNIFDVYTIKEVPQPPVVLEKGWS
jgi:hypothetical protein